jgi:hypothetical protein
MTTKVNLGEKFRQALEEIERVETFKKDVLKFPKEMHVVNNKIVIDGLNELSFTKRGFQSFCEKLDLPSSYMTKLTDTKEKSPNDIFRDKQVLSTCLERGLEGLREDKQILIRTYTNESISKVRAVFSDKYNVVDNLPLVRELSRFDHSELETQNFSLSSDFLDLRFTMPQLKQSIGTLPTHEQRFGMTEDIVFPAIHFRNSETGLSKIQVSFVIYRLVCTNGLTRAKDQYKIIDKKHMGEFDIMALNGRIADVTQNAKKMFEQYVDHMINAKSIKIDNPEEVFESIGKRAGITNRMMNTVNLNWVTEQHSERTKHGIINAITAGARDWGKESNNFSERMRLEEVAGDLLFAKSI